jgi:hypothetical protein
VARLTSPQYLFGNSTPTDLTGSVFAGGVQEFEGKRLRASDSFDKRIVSRRDVHRRLAD